MDFNTKHNLNLATGFITKRLILASTLVAVGMSGSLPAIAEENSDDGVISFTISKKGEVTKEQIAFVPFSGDAYLSFVVQKDLQDSPLDIKADGHIGMPHSSNELRATLPAWQQLNIPYLIVGKTRNEGGRHIIDFEVIEVANGRIIKGKHTVSDSDRKAAGHKAASFIYELITNKKEDLTAKLLYVEEQGSGQNMTSSLIVRDADGSNPKLISKVSNANIYNPTVSPDGRYYVYSVQNQYNRANLWQYDPLTNRTKLLVDLKGNNLSPSYSPDGSSILFSSTVNGNADIYRVSSFGGDAQKVVALPYDQVTPAYAPDGSFVFTSDHQSPNRPSIYRYSPTGSYTRLSQGGYAANPNFSPDGTKIGYLKGSNAAIMNKNGTDIINFGSTNGLDLAPDFSPTGQRVVYAKGQDKSNIIIRYIDGGKVITLPTNGEVKSVTWIPNRRY